MQGVSLSGSSATPPITPPRLYFRVPPEPSHLLRARERLRDYLRLYCTEAELIDDLVLCIEEACTNAIRHSGSEHDIEIALQFEPGRLTAQVKDHGPGFDVTSFDPRRRPDPGADHGRGLFIIAALMDSLELRLDGGLEVRMARRAVPRCEPAPLESGLGAPRTAEGAGQSDARTRAMLEEIGEAFFALDWEYRYLHANRAALRLANKSLDELLGRTPWELFPQLQDSLLAARYRAAMELGEPSVLEHRSVLTGDWLEVRIYPTPAGVSAYFREIIDRKRREDEREILIAEQHRHAQFNEALNAINSAVGAHRDSSAVLQDVLGLAGEAFGCDAGSVAVRDHGQWTSTNVWNMPTDFIGRRFRSEDAPYADLALAERRPVPLEDCRHDPLGNPAPADQLDAGASLTIPLVVGGEGFGCLFFTYFGASHHFSETEVDFARKTGAVVSQALENARLFEAELAARQSETQRVGRLSALKDVADSASSSLDVRTVASRVVNTVHRLLAARQVQIRLVNEDRTALESAAGVGLPRGFLERLGPIPLDSDWETAVCFRSRQPRVGEDVAVSGVSDASLQNARDAGVRSYVLLPLIAGSEAIGTFYVAWAEPRRLRHEELSFAAAVAAQSVAGLQNARLYEAEQKAQRQAQMELEKTRLLQEVTTTATSSLSLDEIGRRVLALTTRALEASGGAVYVVDEAQGTLRALALAGYPEEVAGHIAVVSLDESFSIGYLVVHDLPLITHDSHYIGPSSEEHARHLSVEGTRWCALPIRSAGAILGVLGFMFAGERPFADEELSLYRSIAELLGAALQNARLYDAQRRIATTLQENFIHKFPTVAGLDLGVVGSTAYEPELVGGDFSDVFALDDTHVVALIGDVAGKGVRAAGHTETVRSKVRSFATVDPSPAYVLAKTNELLLRFDPDEPHVTAFLAVLDPHSGHLSYASAGHPPPVHLSAVSCRLLDVPFGPPLGSFELPYANAGATLARGDYLVFYTDGVTEARRGRELLGAERLLEIVAGLRGRRAADVAAGVRDAVLAFGGRLRDDLQVVVLRLV
jgi:PAS domain S-box-containing protein